MILLFSLLLNFAFAITNFDGCEPELVIDSRHTVALAPNQIAVRGKLSELYEMGCEDLTGWVITDRFIYDEVAPLLETSVFWLEQNSDHVYILDRDGHVVVDGVYDEFVKEGKVWFPGRGKMTRLNRPRLNVTKGGGRAYADYKVLQAFTREEEAVVVRTLTPDARARLDQYLGPWMRRYEEHVVHKKRMRFGEAIVEPKSFEKIIIEPVHVEWRVNVFRERYLAVSMIENGRAYDLASNRRLIPLDEANRALGDFTVKDAGAHEDILRRAARVVTLAPVF